MYSLIKKIASKYSSHYLINGGFFSFVIGAIEILRVSDI
jgi:hypothetical protein